MKISKKIFFGLLLMLTQSCDCHGIWSENARRMDQCLKDHKEDKEFCQNQMDKVGGCGHINFEQSR